MSATWNELVRVALIGTDRVKISAPLLKKLEELGVSTEGDSAQIILEGASFLSLMQRSGGYLKKWEKQLPPSCPQDNNTACSTTSAHHLSLILDGAYEMALPEFIQQLYYNNKCLPPELLPDLLDRCLNSRDLWEKIKPTIGNRGQWLIRQNSHWQVLAQSPESEHWETGSHEQRKALLQSIRDNTPQKALKLIKSTWKEDSLQQRISFLKILKTHLSLEDEDFLESCLDDSRKEIRRVAADLLAKLPDSQLVQRVWTKLQSFFKVTKKLLSKTKLEITLPDQITDEMIRDGVDPGAQWYKGGVKASRIGQMIALVPPKKWETFFGKTPSEVLQLFINSNWPELLLQAMVEATYRHQDINWLEVIFNCWRENQGQQRWLTFDPKKLLEVLNEESFNKLAILSLEQKDKLMDENSPITTLLRVGRFPWDDRLTRLAIKNIQDWIAGQSGRFWSGWHLRNIFKQAAHFCNPDLLRELEQGWNTNANAWASWEREIDHFLSVLKFRKEMIEELNTH